MTWEWAFAQSLRRGSESVEAALASIVAAQISKVRIQIRTQTRIQRWPGESTPTRAPPAEATGSAHVFQVPLFSGAWYSQTAAPSIQSAESVNQKISPNPEAHCDHAEESTSYRYTKTQQMTGRLAAGPYLKAMGL